MENDERRQYQRVPVPRVLVRVATEERMRSAYLKDLSEGGLFIRSERQMPLGCQVEVQLLPPGRAEPLPLTGEVVRLRAVEGSTEADPPGMGVKFAELEPSVAKALADLLAAYSTPAPGPSDRAIIQEQALQLRVVSEQVGVLRREVDARELDLTEERGRRLETQHRLTEAVRELEALKGRPVAAPNGSTDALKQLSAEYASAQTELQVTRDRLAQARATITSLEEELRVLEQDDVTSRKFAEKLALERRDLMADVEKRAARASELSAEVESERAKSRGLADQLAVNDRATETERGRVREIERQLEQERLERSRAEGRAERLDALEREHAQTVEHVTAQEAELTAAQQQLAAAKSSAELLTSELKATVARLEKSKTKERELRELMALAATGGARAAAAAANPADGAAPEVEVLPGTLEPAGPSSAGAPAAAASAPAAELPHDDWAAGVPEAASVPIDIDEA